MSDDTPAKPSKKIDDTQFRQELFGEASFNAEGQPDVPTRDERGERAAPDAARSAPTARPSAGYRNPPPETRFTKGKSGNPGGRPRGTSQKKATTSPNAASSTDAILRRHFGKPMRVREGGETFEITRLEGLLKLLEQQAAAGSVLAARILIEMLTRTARQQEAEREDDEAFWRNYCDTYPEAAERRSKAGDPLPEWMPRPEDVIIKPGKDIRIIGHSDEKSYDDMLLLKQWRDAMHVKIIYDLDIFFSKPGIRTTMTMAEFIVHWFDHLMPMRWKLASKEMRDREAILLFASRPKLLNELTLAFDALGLPPFSKDPMSSVPDRLLRALQINPKEMRASYAKREAEKTRDREKGKRGKGVDMKVGEGEPAKEPGCIAS